MLYKVIDVTDKYGGPKKGMTYAGFRIMVIDWDASTVNIGSDALFVDVSGGLCFQTSLVKRIIFCGSTIIVETLHSIYHLAKIAD